jgi:SAM-dependent methyltransferase
MWPEYAKLWDYHHKTPLVPITYEDFEHLSYQDNYFDMVHCVNALDHTVDARQALSELERVCKPGGWIYLRHAPDQKKHYGGMHRFDASTSGFDNGTELVPLDGYDVHLAGDLIVATKQK